MLGAKRDGIPKNFLSELQSITVISEYLGISNLNL